MQLHIYIIFAQQYVYARSVAPTVTNATIYMQNQAAIHIYIIYNIYILCIFIFHAHMHYINMSAVMSQIRHLNSAMQA